MKGKIFTRAEADRMIPLLRRIVRSVRACERLMGTKRRTLSCLPVSHGPQRSELRLDLKQLESGQSRFNDEVEELGCILRDRRRGVVECFGEFEGEIVYFTWWPGSSSFDHWHSLDTSPTSARPLPAPAEVAD